MSWQDPLDNGRGHLPLVISSLFINFISFYFILFMICPRESLNLPGCSLWGYYSWCNKLSVGSGRGLFTIGDFPSNYSRGAAPASTLLRKPQLASRSWPLSLLQFCIQALWCCYLGLHLIVSVSIFILSPNFTFYHFIWFVHDFNISTF